MTPHEAPSEPSTASEPGTLPELSVPVDVAAGARRLVPWRRAPFPAPWDAWFGSEGPIDLEIGFGDGRYTVRRAIEHPGARFVGIEVSGVSVRRALAKLRKEELGNVRLVKGGAQMAVRQLFAPASLASVTVNFPDPWPKGRHAENRLLRVPFLTLLAERLRPGGEIRLATDHPDYLAFSRDEARRSGLYDLERREPPAAVFETKYALKWRDQGKPLHYLVFVRNDVAAPSSPPIERPAIMPHALFRGEPSDQVRFDKRVLPYAGGHVVLHELMRSLGGDGGRDRLVVRATVDEPDLVQQLLVVVQRREGDAWIVRLESFGDPIVTPAVRGAVHAVTAWLETHASVTVDARNY